MAGRYAVGVDFGGTKILAAVVNLETGRLVGTGKKKTRQVHEQEDVIKRIASVVDESLAEAGMTARDIEGIGIGAAGQVNREKGVLVFAANIGVSDLPLAQPLAQMFQLPCALGNDVEIATLGEVQFGAGRRCDSLVCVFVGTGIGSCIVHDGTIYRGASGSAGEIGHVVIDPFGRQCGCGAFGCLEAYASRTAIAKHIVAELKRGADSMIRDRIDMTKGILRSKAISDAIEAGDDLVKSAVSQAAQFLGLGLASVINFYNPQRIILGGGMIEASEYYFHHAVKHARQRALRVPARKIEFVKAELGDYAGVIGAALLVKGK